MQLFNHDHPPSQADIICRRFCAAIAIYSVFGFSSESTAKRFELPDPNPTARWKNRLILQEKWKTPRRTTRVRIYWTPARLGQRETVAPGGVVFSTAALDGGQPGSFADTARNRQLWAVVSKRVPFVDRKTKLLPGYASRRIRCVAFVAKTASRVRIDPKPDMLPGGGSAAALRFLA